VPDESVNELVIQRLSLYLGPHTARMAMKTFAKQALGLPPDQVLFVDAPKLLAALRPMLRTLLGSDHAEAVVRELTIACEGR